MITVKDLVKRYQKEVLALDNVSLEMRGNEILGILGPNGCGKTTLINCILGLINHESGEIRFNGEKIKSNHLQQIGIVPQELSFIDALTVEENVDFFCGLYIKDKVTRKQYVKEAIEFVALQGYEKRKSSKLSGGLKRRLNIACGIAHKPKLVILDEPTVAIDPQSRNFILEGLKKLNQQGVGIIYTTHYMEEAEILCDRIAIMDIANFVVVGSKKEIMNEMGIHAVLKMDSDKEFNIPKHVKKHGVNEYILENEFALEELLKELKQQEVSYSIVEMNQPTLNDIFLILTGKVLRDE